MLPKNPNIQNENESWKEQVKKHFQKHSVSSQRKRHLEELLLNSGKQKNIKFFNNLTQKLKKVYLPSKKIYLSHVVTALVAASTTFFFLNVFENSNHDFISEMVSALQDANALPPDFDLVGDSSALPQLSMDSLPNQSFEPVIPQQLAQSYFAAEGRFFLFKGLQGVSIKMEPNLLNKKVIRKKPATLYIVKLSKKNENFPKKNVLKKIQASATKIKKVYAWREGAYGYVMVQPIAANENTLEDNILVNDEWNPLN